MKTFVRSLAMGAYTLFGVLFLLAGASVLLVNTGLLPEAIQKFVADESQSDLGLLHVIQEFGTLMVFAGLISLWFVRHYESSQFFHWAMTTFWGLLALVHWIDVRGPNDSIGGPLITTIPFMLFAMIGLLRLATEGGRVNGEVAPRLT